MLPAWSDVVQRRRRGRLGAGAFAAFVAQRATAVASDETKAAPQEQPIDEQAADEKPIDEQAADEKQIDEKTHDDAADAWERELASYAQQRLEALRAVVRAKAPRLGGHIGRAITRALWSFAAPVLAAYRPARIFDARRSLAEDSNRLAYGFGVAVDDSDDDPERFAVYVADVAGAVIVRFRGDHVDILGEGALARPYDVVATRSGTLYVADRDANAIVRVDADGSAETVVAELSAPVALALDADGALVVAERGADAGVRAIVDETTAAKRTAPAAPVSRKVAGGANGRGATPAADIVIDARRGLYDRRTGHRLTMNQERFRATDQLNAVVPRGAPAGGPRRAARVPSSTGATRASSASRRAPASRRRRHGAATAGPRSTAQRLYVVEVARRRVVRYDPVWV
ncbi:hypothetical protein JL720_11074 [Aureococcus anophagefferens]|nr:hypothetical protein JL720_11074 [Aureococcus anophagefferens]